MTTFILIYLSGVLVVLACGIIQLHNQTKVCINDLFDIIVFSALSWGFILLYIEQKLTNWIEDKGWNAKIWRKE